MKINFPILNKSVSFSKNKNARNANDILRETKKEYPAFAPNYADFYFLCLRKNSKRKERASEIMSSIIDKHEKLVRKSSLEHYPYSEVLAAVKKYKYAQCWEQMLCAISILQKHGYTAIPAALGVKMRLINKNTHEIEREKIASLDHDLVLSNMGDENRKKLREVYFIDPWLNFSGSHSEAVAKYKTAFQINLLKEKYKFLIPLPNNQEDYIYTEKIGFFPLKIENE